MLNLNTVVLKTLLRSLVASIDRIHRLRRDGMKTSRVLYGIGTVPNPDRENRPNHNCRL
jgi:hypothetical protein